MRIFKLSVLFFFICSLSFGQQKFQEGYLKNEIPVDPTVKIGKLENGLTYYIKKNSKTEDKAELRLVVNAGSVLEEESQQGLAHFLEHMAFNGTTNFEKNELINYLESMGVEFGADLNAHTSFEETVYKLSLPTDEENFTTGLTILRDWADGIILSDEEIDAERGVVAEEMRAGLGVGRRMFNAYFPIITNNSVQSTRLPIGKLDVILNSDYEEIRRFYRDWYRPDLMAVIIVGDVNIEDTEAKIKKHFASMKNLAEPKERTEFPIPDLEEPAIAILTDPEQTDVGLQVYFLKDRVKPETLKEYRDVLVRRLYSGMINTRLDEMVEKGEASFLTASVGMGTFIADKSSYYTGASLKEDQIMEGIRELLLENERAKRFGFSEGELERYKSIVLNSADLARKEDGKRNSRYYLEQYIDHFMDQDPIPGNQFIYDFYKEELPKITLEEVEAIGKEWFNNGPFALILQAPEKEGLEIPSKDEMVSLVSSIDKATLKPYVDDFEGKKLMEEKPIGGEITETEFLESIGVTKLQLDNNVTVLLKPTTLQNDIINMSAFRPGGSSIAPDSIYIPARTASQLVFESGFNGYTPSDVRKLTAGKTVSVKPFINFYEEMFRGMSSEEDFETMLQMVYLYFTAPNKDRGVFQSHKERLISGAKNMDLNSSRFFYNEIARIMAQDHPRAVAIEAEQYEEELKLDQAFEFYKERFAGADGFTFIFVGNFDVEQVKPLIETYVGGLPSTGEFSDWRDIGLRRPQGVIEKEYYLSNEDKAEVALHFVGDVDFSLEEKQLINALGKVLKLRLYEELREKRGDVYGVRVSPFATDAPYEWYRIGIEYSTDPEVAKELLDIIFDKIENLKTEGPLAEDVVKVKEALLLNVEEGMDYNSYWTNELKEMVEYDRDPESILKYKESIDKITAEKIQEAAKKYFNMDNYGRFILYPKKQ